MPIEQWSERIWLVRLGDEPSLLEELATVRLQAEAAAEPPDIVLDLSAIKSINSSHLAQILRLRKLAITRDVKLRLAAPRDSVWAVFLVTGLEKVLECAPDVSTALAGLQLER